MKTIHWIISLLAIVLISLVLLLSSSQTDNVDPDASVESPSMPSDTADVEFTLQTLIHDGGLAYIGIGGEIDGVINPDLIVQPGAVVRVILLNGDGMPHDLFLPDFNTKTSYVSRIGEQTEIAFQVGDIQPGTYVYYCTLPGHRQAGQEGKLIVVAHQG